MRRDDLRRRAGGVYARIVGQASRDAIACALGVDPSNVSRRTSGVTETPLSRLAEEVWDMESLGHDTAEMLGMLTAVREQVRQAVGLSDAELLDAYLAADQAEQLAEGVQNASQSAVGLGGCPGRVAEATEHEVATEIRLAALAREVKARGLDVRTGARRR